MIKTHFKSIYLKVNRIISYLQSFLGDKFKSILKQLVSQLKDKKNRTLSPVFLKIIRIDSYFTIKNSERLF